MFKSFRVSLTHWLTDCKEPFAEDFDKEIDHNVLAHMDRIKI